MESMKALLCTLVLVSSFGYGTCEKCWNDYNCKYGCCNWECCAGYNYYVYLGVGVTFGVVTIIGVVVIIACLLKKNTRPGRVIAATRPAPGLAVHSHFTATNSSGQTQSSSFVYPAPQGSPGYDPYSAYPPPGAASPPPDYSTHPPTYQEKS
ncbi:cysteine and tyrosine-rich protein 1-like [Haliotis rubra]|uniref:cysteine and tyrosine-rich protein 1-like n=1 Tax=Haliotis rubra TaxID=36100 RepID=UPI001EE60663|nr:cysteine and tyrosine-rich protein 1-like [Haliotis rubra]